jgi:hypothetical protein
MPVHGPDYILQLGDGPPEVPPEAWGSSSANLPGPGVGRPWIAVRWQCCSAYSRVYRNRSGTAYEGRCPRCGKPVKATIGEGGTDARFFDAS